MAHSVCRIQGFSEAEAVLQGDKLVGNDSCASNQEYNSTCDFFEKQTSSSCNVSNETVAVCKGNCANISCEGGQHCNATKDGPKSGNSSIDSNGKDPDKDRPHVNIATDNFTFTVDDRVNLQCKIQDTGVFIAAKWIREETKQTLETANFSRSDEHSNDSKDHHFYYVIKKVSTKDRGIYRCIANFSGYGPVDARYKLQVRGKC